MYTERNLLPSAPFEKLTRLPYLSDTTPQMRDPSSNPNVYMDVTSDGKVDLYPQTKSNFAMRKGHISISFYLQ